MYAYPRGRVSRPFHELNFHLLCREANPTINREEQRKLETKREGSPLCKKKREAELRRRSFASLKQRQKCADWKPVPSSSSRGGVDESRQCPAASRLKLPGNDAEIHWRLSLQALHPTSTRRPSLKRCQSVPISSSLQTHHPFSAG